MEGLASVTESGAKHGEHGEPRDESTVPTQEEIQAKIQIGKLSIAINKVTSLAVETAPVQEGYAYRSYAPDSGRDTAWQWLRLADFDRQFDLFIIQDPQATLDVMDMACESWRAWKKRCEVMVRLMGSKSRERLRQYVEVTRDVSLQAFTDIDL